jgi:hypothetical protein
MILLLPCWGGTYTFHTVLINHHAYPVGLVFLKAADGAAAAVDHHSGGCAQHRGGHANGEFHGGAYRNFRIRLKENAVG